MNVRDMIENYDLNERAILDAVKPHIEKEIVRYLKANISDIVAESVSNNDEFFQAFDDVVLKAAKEKMGV